MSGQDKTAMLAYSPANSATLFKFKDRTVPSSTEEGTLDRHLSLLKFKDHDVRTIQIDGEPWFVASDVCQSIGLVPMNNGRGVFTYSHHLRKLADDERQVLRKSEVSGAPQTVFGWKTPSVALVAGSGLYKLVMRSDKPEAKDL